MSYIMSLKLKIFLVIIISSMVVYGAYTGSSDNISSYWI